MKKQTIFKIIVAAASILFYQAVNNGANAQGAYVTAGMGYNLPAGSIVLGYNQTGSGTSSNETVVSGSLGKGISFGAGFGYMFSANVGAELGFSYLSGSTYTITDTYIDPYFGNVHTSTTKIKGKMMRLTPAIRISAGEKLKPYAKFGLVIGLIPKAYEDGSSELNGTVFPTTDRYSGGTSIGWTGALGIDFNLSGMIAIFLELNTINQSWSPSKDVYTRTEIDYSNGIPVQIIKSGTTTYVKTDTGIPDQQTKGYIPFGSFGVNAGIKFSFSGTKATAPTAPAAK